MINEQSLIGALLIDPSIITSLKVQPQHLQDMQCKGVLTAALSLHEQDKAIDFVTLSSEVDRLGLIVSTQQMATLAADTPSAANWQTYEDAIKQAVLKRYLTSTVKEAERMIEGKPEEVAAWITEKMKVADIKRQSIAKTLSQSTVSDLIDSGSTNPPTWGTTGLDGNLVGIEKHHYIILTGECFIGDTKVLMSDNNYKKIKDVVIGDVVISTNTKTKFLEPKKVLKTFKYTGNVGKPKRLITFILSNGEKITSTENHEYYIAGDWVSAKRLAERKMEKTLRFGQSVSRFEYGEGDDARLEKQMGQQKKCTQDNKTIIRREWLFQNNVKAQKRKDKNNQNPQDCVASMEGKCRGKTVRRPYRLQQDKQQGGEFKVGNMEGELSPQLQSWKDKEGNFTSEHGGRGAKMEFKTDRKNSQRNTDEIYSAQIHAKDAGARIQSKNVHNTRLHIKEELEACEIDMDGVVGIIFLDYLGDVYDLNVEDNHNYVVSENNIIVHNSGAGKSTYTFFMAEKNAGKGIKVLYLSLEENKSGLITRMARARASISPQQWHNRSNGGIAPNQRTTYKQRFKELQENDNLILVGGADFKEDKNIAMIERVIRESGADMVIIDNFNKIAVDPKINSVANENAVSQFFLDYTNRHQVPIIVVHHYAKGKASQRGQQSLRGSAKIGDDADMVVSYTRDLDGDNDVAIIKQIKDRDFGKNCYAAVQFERGSFIDSSLDTDF